MRPALLIGAGLAALVAFAGPARAAAPQPCEPTAAPTSKVSAPCEPTPCRQAAAAPCER